MVTCSSCNAKIHPLVLLSKANGSICPACGGPIVSDPQLTVNLSSRALDRNVFLYMEPQKGQALDHHQFATCNYCLHFTGVTCALHGHEVRVYNDSSCGLFCAGKPRAIYGEEYPYVTPEETGLIHRKSQCQDCKWFDKISSMCRFFELLNRIHKGVFQINVYVDPYGACNAFVPSDAEYFKLLEPGEENKPLPIPTR